MKQRWLFVGCVLVFQPAGTGCGGSKGDGKTFEGPSSEGIGGTSGPLGGGIGPGGVGGSNQLVSSPAAGTDAGAVTGPVGDPRCTGNATTTISGTVYDPAIQDPLYNVTVYIPSAPLPALPKGANCNSCSDLYPATVIASTVTDEHGQFTITKANPGPVIPEGTVPLVIQTGKWRMQVTANVTKCIDNPQADKTLHLPTSAAEGDLPDIAISTGTSDSLECLPLRIGVAATEYTSGAAGPGHIHVFQGNGATTAAGAPMSSAALWDTTADLMANDAVLLSCEGAETANMTAASQQSMWNYAGGGGRVFASHFHYAWFSNVLGGANGFGGGAGVTTPNTGPFAMANLAKWTPGSNTISPMDMTSLPGDVVTTLNVGGGPFPEGMALGTWLGVVGALTNGQLPIWFSRHNADVGPMNTPSQPWIVLDPSVAAAPSATQYFSFDTPIGAPAGGTCGRVVYSDLHVSGGPGMGEPGVLADYAGAGGMRVRGGMGGMGGVGRGGNAGVTPAGCAMHPLTPQEKALEFMLFDLTSCLQSVGQPPKMIVAPPK